MQTQNAVVKKAFYLAWIQLQALVNISPIKQFFSLLYSASASNASPVKTRPGFEPNVGFAFCKEIINTREYCNQTALYYINQHKLVNMRFICIKISDNTAEGMLSLRAWK